MPDKTQGIIVSGDEEFSDLLDEEVRAVVDVVDRLADNESAYYAIKDLKPGAVFVHLTNGNEAGLTLAGRITRTLPGTSVFLVSPEKDPDQILEALRLGAADYLVFPDGKDKILPAVRRALGRAEAGGKIGELFAFFSLKGGQGLTALAINLADQLQTLTAEKVLLADLNLYMGDVNTCLNLQSAYTPFDLLNDLERMDDNLLFSSLTRHPNGFYVLTAPEEISDADQISGEDITRMFGLLKKHLDYIIVDLPHDFSERTLAAIEEADRLLLVAQQSLPVIKSVQRTLQLFRELNYPENKVKIILNRYLKKSELSPDDLAHVFNQPVFSVISNDYRALTETVNKGRTIGQAHGVARINDDIAELAGRLAGISSSSAKQSGWRGLLGHVFSPHVDKLK